MLAHDNQAVLIFADMFEGADVNYFLSGMGDNCCYKSSNKDQVPAGKHSARSDVGGK